MADIFSGVELRLVRILDPLPERNREALLWNICHLEASLFGYFLFIVHIHRSGRVKNIHGSSHKIAVDIRGDDGIFNEVKRFFTGRNEAAQRFKIVFLFQLLKGIFGRGVEISGAVTGGAQSDLTRFQQDDVIVSFCEEEQGGAYPRNPSADDGDFSFYMLMDG